MDKIAILLTVVIIAAGSTLGGQGRSVRVTGEVVALQCYPRLGEEGRGEAHAACARHCVAGGSELGLLTDETLYRLKGDSSVMKQVRGFAAEQITIEGVVTDQADDVLLEIETIDAHNP